MRITAANESVRALAERRKWEDFLHIRQEICMWIEVDPIGWTGIGLSEERLLGHFTIPGPSGGLLKLYLA